MDKGMEEFLKKGNLSNSGFWEDQIGFFLLTLLFLIVQWFVSPVLMGICACIEIILLSFCKKRETRLYANVSNCSIQFGILMMLWWIDGWCAISLIATGHIFWILNIVGTMLFMICILWRIRIVKQRIVNNWYAQLTTTKAKIGPVIIFSVVSLAVMRLVLRNINLGNEIVFFILACICFLLDLLLIFTVDLAMRAYYFSKLTVEEQKYIVTGK